MNTRREFLLTGPVAGLAGALGANAQSPTEDTAKRRAELQRLLRILPRSEAWERWLARSGELPPDFDALPRSADLPDPLLISVDGRSIRISTRESWYRRRRQLVQLFQHYVFGAVPPPPENMRVSISRTQRKGGATHQDIQLEFGPDYLAKLSVELMVRRAQVLSLSFSLQCIHEAGDLSRCAAGTLCAFLPHRMETMTPKVS